MAIKEVYDCEILISEIEKVLLSTTVLRKNTVMRVSKTDCGEKCARQSFVSGANWTAQRSVIKAGSVVDVSTGLRTGSRIFLYTTLDSLLDEPKTSFFSLRFAFEATEHIPMLYPCSP
jgi:hypothetical protein